VEEREREWKREWKREREREREQDRDITHNADTSRILSSGVVR